jgi:hypothetical protein
MNLIRHYIVCKLDSLCYQIAVKINPHVFGLEDAEKIIEVLRILVLPVNIRMKGDLSNLNLAHLLQNTKSTASSGLHREAFG